MNIPGDFSYVPPLSGDMASRRRQYWLAAGLAVLVVGIGHRLAIDSTYRVYLLVESLITMVAFITGMFALVRYFSNRSTLYLYGGVGFVAIGTLELVRLLAYTTGFTVSSRAGLSYNDEFLLWSGTVNHLFLSAIIVLAMWDTHGRGRAMARNGKTVAVLVAGLTAACGVVILTAPIPPSVPPVGSGFVVARPWELLPGGMWVFSGAILFRQGEWQRDTFVHWLIIALIFAAGAGCFLLPFAHVLTSTATLAGQLLKLTAFILVLVGLANSMFELVKRVEISRAHVQRLNHSLEQEIQVRRETEQALLASRAELAEAQQIAHLGSWSWTPELNQHRLSPELLQIFGETSMTGAGAIDLVRKYIHPDDWLQLEQVVAEAMMLGKDFETQCRIVHKDGQVRTLLLRGRRSVDTATNRVRYQGTAQDLTELVETQRRLHSLAEQLAASNRDLEEFANIASHDLQEPLRKIFAFSDRVITRYGDALDATALDYLDRVRQSALRMQHLIEGVLTLSRVQTPHAATAHVEIAAVVREVLDDLAARLEESEAQVEVGTLPRVRGDAVQLRQLFQNLIGNALKFSRSPAPPVVRIYSTSHEDEWVTLVVEDEGIGFDARYAERIFQPFHRLHSRARYEGTGMGLAICRRIVERHGGQIYAESTPDEGSQFFIRLPRAENPANRSGASAPEPAENGSVSSALLVHKPIDA